MSVADITEAFTVVAVIVAVALLMWRDRQRIPPDVASDQHGDWSTLSEQAGEIARRLDITAADARKLAEDARHLRASNAFAADITQVLAPSGATVRRGQRQVPQPISLRHPQRKDVQ